MIEKREDNTSSITVKGLNESISTISLENVDQYLKQLEVQKLQAQSNISSSFRELSALLIAREKQLLRQVDAMHDHLILFLQSRKSFFGDNYDCCKNGDDDFEMTTRNNSLGHSTSCNVKATPGIEVTLNAEELKSQIHVFGKVEMTGASFMHLSEDNEGFDFPYRVQNYQETGEDHMLLYKSLETTETGYYSASAPKNPDFETPVINGKVHKETKSTDNSEFGGEAKSTILVSFPLIPEGYETVESNADAPNISEEETKHSDEREMEEIEVGVRQFDEGRSEDVQHWMREILCETNSEPTSNDPDPGRFDLFTVLKCNHKKDFQKERLNPKLEPQHTPYFLTSDLSLKKDMITNIGMDLVHQSQQEYRPVEAEPNECDLLD